MVLPVENRARYHRIECGLCYRSCYRVTQLVRHVKSIEGSRPDDLDSNRVTQVKPALVTWLSLNCQHGLDHFPLTHQQLPVSKNLS